MDAYSEAHLLVAAIRILQHKSGSQPTVEEVCSMLGFSSEQGLAISRKLRTKGIVDLLEDPFSIRLAIADYLLIEDLPKDSAQESNLSKELEQFMAKKKKEEKKIESIQAELEEKKRSMFESIEQKLKKEMGNNN